MIIFPFSSGLSTGTYLISSTDAFYFKKNLSFRQDGGEFQNKP